MNTSVIISASAAITSCSSPSALLYLCVATPAANSVNFFVDANKSNSAASGPSRSSFATGPAITSSISVFIAGTSASLPEIADLIIQPLIISRLISLVPSKIRLMRESR